MRRDRGRCSTVICSDIIQIQPRWINRDYFILSAGTAACFLYAWLNLSGYDVSVEDIKRFRQLHSKTPGHPEYLKRRELNAPPVRWGKALATRLV